MGSGSSKNKNGSAKPGGKNVVVADVVLPNGSESIRVIGQLNQAPPTNGGSQATVKEIGPNKFSVQMGEQNIGTFETSGDANGNDFASYLANAASLTVKNIETVAEEADGSKMEDSHSASQPLVIQLADTSKKEYDVDWEEVIEDVGVQGTPKKKGGRGIRAQDEANGAKDKKAQLKQALKNKRAKLSEQEYEQMIANHRQEVELMNLLREKEKERQKFSLASKVAARQKKRKAKQAIHEGIRDVTTEVDTPEDNTRLQELQEQITQQKAQMEQEMAKQKQAATGSESEHIIEAHKEKMAELEGELGKERKKRNQALIATLEERKRLRKAQKAEKEERMRLQAGHVMTAAELQRLETELKERQAQFEVEMREKRGTISNEEYKRLIATHKLELADLQHKLDIQRERQQQSLLDKLAARQARRNNKAEEKALIAKLEVETVTMKDPSTVASDPALTDAMSADEIKELQLAISKKDMEFRKTLKEVKTNKSEGEAQEFIEQHRKEMEEMQQQLDLEKARMKLVLMAKLEARRRKGGEKNEVDESDPAMSSEEVKQLQLILDQKSANFKQRQKMAKKEMPVADYQKFLDEHKRDMDSLERRLAREKMRMEQSLKDKMAARRFRRPGSSTAVRSHGQSEEIKEIENEMGHKEAIFVATVEAKISEMSKDEYDRLLKNHQREMDELKKRLDRAKERQRMHFQDKLDERRRRRKMWQNEEEERMRLMKILEKKNESMNLEEFGELVDDIQNYDEMVSSNIQEKKGKVSLKDHEKLLDDHKKHMEDLNQRLQNKMSQSINEEINQIENEMGHKKAMFVANVETSRADMTKDEYDRLLKQHQQEMDELKKRLDRAKERQRMHFQDKLDERRRRRKMWQNEEEERMRLMKILENKKDPMSLDDLEDLENDILIYDAAVSSSIQGKKGKVSVEECEKMLADHKKNMAAMNQRLQEQRERMTAELMEKREARRGKPVQQGVTISMYQASQGNDEESDDAHDSEGDDEVTELSGFQTSYQSSQASTTLWTTPTQSNDVVIVPLAEEYPVKRKRELYTDPAIFKSVDAHAIRLAQTVSLVTQPTFSALVNELTEFGTSELQKVRLIFRWLTAQNCEEMDLNDVIDDTPLGVLKGLYHKKITFSTLFMRMCRFVGLHCVEICGIAKVKGYKPGQFISPKDMDFQHTWNAVRIDGFWHFVDCNWGVSHIAGSVTYDPFRFEYDEHYFLADPDVIISSHFPNDSAWQLLQRSLTLDDFNNQVLLKPDFFKFGFELMSHQCAIVDVPQGDLDIRILCPPGFILSCRLSTVGEDRDVAMSGIPFDLYEFIHQISDNAMACFLRIPEAGQFYLTLYSKRQYMDGELNVESQTEICRYFVRCHAPSNDRIPLPYSPADHWGPIGTMNAGLIPITHRSSVAMSLDGRDFNIRFKKLQKLWFSHTLTSYGVAEKQLVPFAMQRVIDDELAFTVTPPRPGRYALHIHVHYPGVPQPAHLCSYLLVSECTRPTVYPMPLLQGEEWGPTIAFKSLGLSAFTNPDAFIVTRDPVTQIIVGTQSRVFLQHRMICNGQDISHLAQPQFWSGFITFVLEVSRPGYYHFKLMGKETNDPSVPSAIVFNYLIRKD